MKGGARAALTCQRKRGGCQPSRDMELGVVRLTTGSIFSHHDGQMSKWMQNVCQRTERSGGGLTLRTAAAKADAPASPSAPCHPDRFWRSASRLAVRIPSSPPKPGSDGCAAAARWRACPSFCRRWRRNLDLDMAAVAFRKGSGCCENNYRFNFYLCGRPPPFSVGFSGFCLLLLWDGG